MTAHYLFEVDLLFHLTSPASWKQRAEPREERYLKKRLLLGWTSNHHDWAGGFIWQLGSQNTGTATIIIECIFFIALAFTVRIGKEKSYNYSKWITAVNVIHVTAVWHGCICMQMSNRDCAMIQMSEPALALKSAPSKPFKIYAGHSLTSQGTSLPFKALLLAYDITPHGLQPAPLDVQHILCCKENSAKNGYLAAMSNKRMLLKQACETLSGIFLTIERYGL